MALDSRDKQKDRSFTPVKEKPLQDSSSLISTFVPLFFAHSIHIFHFGCAVGLHWGCVRGQSINGARSETPMVFIKVFPFGCNVEGTPSIFFLSGNDSPSVCVHHGGGASSPGGLFPSCWVRSSPEPCANPGRFASAPPGYLAVITSEVFSDTEHRIGTPGTSRRGNLGNSARINTKVAYRRWEDGPTGWSFQRIPLGICMTLNVVKL